VTNNENKLFYILIKTMDEQAVAGIHIVLGVILGAIGSYVWVEMDKERLVDQFLISLLVAAAGINFFFGLKGYFVDNIAPDEPKEGTPPKWYSKQGLFAIFLVYMGAVFYSLAAFYHLSMPKWTFLKGLAVAIPLILIEYHFSLRANRVIHDTLQWNATQIAFITLIFYFINTWIMNKFIFKRKFVLWRELVALGLLAGAFVVLQWKA
jgi:hypothetical protein